MGPVRGIIQWSKIAKENAARNAGMFAHGGLPTSPVEI